MDGLALLCGGFLGAGLTGELLFTPARFVAGTAEHLLHGGNRLERGDGLCPTDRVFAFGWQQNGAERRGDVGQLFQGLFTGQQHGLFLAGNEDGAGCVWREFQARNQLLTLACWLAGQQVDFGADCGSRHQRHVPRQGAAAGRAEGDGW